MILKSRLDKRWTSSLSRMVRPKKSHARNVLYLGKRILRINATPHALATGFAIGIFASFSPALGLHIIMALTLAWIVGGNLIAAALGTAFANPMTIPMILAGEYEIGTLVFGGHDHIPLTLLEIGSKLSHLDFVGTWEPLFKPLLTGSLVLGALFGLVSYGCVLVFARTYAAARVERGLLRRLQHRTGR